MAVPEGASTLWWWWLVREKARQGLLRIDFCSP